MHVQRHLPVCKREECKRLVSSLRWDRSQPDPCIIISSQLIAFWHHIAACLLVRNLRHPTCCCVHRPTSILDQALTAEGETSSRTLAPLIVVLAAVRARPLSRKRTSSCILAHLLHEPMLTKAVYAAIVLIKAQGRSHLTVQKQIHSERIKAVQFRAICQIAQHWIANRSGLESSSS